MRRALESRTEEARKSHPGLGGRVPHPEFFFIAGSFLLPLTGTIAGSIIAIAMSDEETVVGRGYMDCPSSPSAASLAPEPSSARPHCGGENAA